MKDNKLIIEAAINEQSAKEANPYVPYSPEEIASDALAAACAGASLVHFHARDPQTGALLHPGIEPYRQAMTWIRQEDPDVILYPTYGFSDTPEEPLVMTGAGMVGALSQDLVLLRQVLVVAGELLFPQLRVPKLL